MNGKFDDHDFDRPLSQGWSVIFVVGCLVAATICVVDVLRLYDRWHWGQTLLNVGFAAVFVILAIGTFKDSRVKWQRYRRLKGLCPFCGYDIRATPDRCPECGGDL